MDQEFELEHIFRVYDNHAGACLEVRPHPDGASMLELRTPDDKSKEWYGDLSLTLAKQQALKVSEALRKAALS